LRMAFQHILDLADAPAPDAGAAPARTGRSLEPEIRRFLRRRIVDFDRRIATDIEVKKTLDDKWYFTRSWFEDVAARVGFSSVRILNNQITDHPLLTQTQTYLRNGLGRTRDALPAFAWQILEGYENAMSVHLRNDMLTTGTVILTK
jgi:hypothetical protein